MWSKISFAILKLVGWKTTFEPFPEPRGIIVVYPHTSNWDFPLGLLWKSVNKVKPRWVAKESLFKPPVFGWLMRKLGGIGIKREGKMPAGMQRRGTAVHHNSVIGGERQGQCAFFLGKIGREQQTVDMDAMENAELSVHGRHDPCIVPRAVPVAEAAAALAIWDALLEDAAQR